LRAHIGSRMEMKYGPAVGRYSSLPKIAFGQLQTSAPCGSALRARSKRRTNKWLWRLGRRPTFQRDPCVPRSTVKVSRPNWSGQCSGRPTARIHRGVPPSSRNSAVGGGFNQRGGRGGGDSGRPGGEVGKARPSGLGFGLRERSDTMPSGIEGRIPRYRPIANGVSHRPKHGVRRQRKRPTEFCGRSLAGPPPAGHSSE
jgi:hypothetical protein